MQEPENVDDFTPDEYLTWLLKQNKGQLSKRQLLFLLDANSDERVAANPVPDIQSSPTFNMARYGYRVEVDSKTKESKIVSDPDNCKVCQRPY